MARLRVELSAALLSSTLIGDIKGSDASSAEVAIAEAARHALQAGVDLRSHAASLCRSSPELQSVAEEAVRLESGLLSDLLLVASYPLRPPLAEAKGLLEAELMARTDDDDSAEAANCPAGALTSHQAKTDTPASETKESFGEKLQSFREAIDSFR